MADQKIQIIISAASQGLEATFGRAGRAVKAFRAEVGGGSQVLGGFRSAVAQAVGALGGLFALSKVNTLLMEADKAAFGLAASLRAANRQFDVGSMADWEASLATLSKQLRIYSTTELRNAASRTVDMTKRLGLTQGQMEQLITVTADLSAGKTDLVGGIERVTAALRGEAESAEYLGLTLNEDYVKAWYAVSDATGKAWKDLTDMEKAQVRYNLFLEQALPFQGKAAESVNTLSGAYKLMAKEVTDSIEKNKDVVEAMKEVAEVFRENGTEIGVVVGQVVGLIAKVVEFIAKNHETIKVVGLVSIGLVVLGKTITTMVGVWTGLNAAMTVMTGMRIVPWLTGVNAAVAGTMGTTLTLAGALTTAAAAAASRFAGYKLGAWVTMRGEMKAIADETARLGRYTRDLSAASREAGIGFDLSKASINELTKLSKEGKIHFDEMTSTWKTGSGKQAAAVAESADKQEKAQGDSLEAMKRKYQEYTDEVKRLQDQIADNERSLQAELRDMARGGMSDLGGWNDRKAEAEEYYAAAQKAAEAGDFEAAKKYADMAKQAYRDLNTEVTTSTSNILAQKQAQLEAMNRLTRGGKVAMPLDQLNAYKALQQEVADLTAELREEGESSTTAIISEADALTASMDGVKKSGELANDILEEQKKKAEAAQDALDKESGGQLNESLEQAKQQTLDLNKVIQESGGDWGKVWDEMERDAGNAIDASERRIKELTRDRHIRVFVEEVVKKALGGPVGRFARGGKLAGYGGGDRIHALLEAGEFVMRKEAVSKFGAGIFHMLNSLRLPKFAAGGMVGSGAGGGAVYQVDLRLSDSGRPVRMQTDRSGLDEILRLQAERLRFASS